METNDFDVICKRVGRNLRFLRMQRGWSQERTAEYVDVDRNMVGLLERGECDKINFGLRHLYPLARLFDVSIGRLIDDDLSAIAHDRRARVGES